MDILGNREQCPAYTNQSFVQDSFVPDMNRNEESLGSLSLSPPLTFRSVTSLAEKGNEYEVTSSLHQKNNPQGAGRDLRSKRKRILAVGFLFFFVLPALIRSCK